VADIVKRAAAVLGRNPAEFAGHSLRSGFITEAVRSGASERAIMSQTGHRSVNILRGYVRRATGFEDNAAAVIGL
jgi:integrase